MVCRHLFLFISALVLSNTALAESTVPPGDLYVSSNQPGARIFMDGADTGYVTPVLLRGISAGTHHVLLRTGCARAELDVVVAPSVISRAETNLAIGPGVIDFRVFPAGAQVRVDDVEIGISPLILPAQTCGSHKVDLRAPGFIEATIQVEVTAFETATVNMALTPELYGRLSLLPTPLDAVFFVDGVEVGAGPRTIDPIAVGPHSVRAELTGYTPVEGSVEVVVDQVARMDLSLFPLPAPKRPPWPRITLNTVTGVSGLALGALAISSHIEGRSAYNHFQAVPSDIEAERIWDEEVVPARTRSLIEGTLGGVLLASSVALWMGTDIQVVAGPRSVVFAGRL